MAKVLGLDHVSIVVKDADASLKFYQTVLGLECVERPDLGFPGYWLDLKQGQTLHLMQVDNINADFIPAEHAGSDSHFALRVDSISEFAQILQQHSLDFTRSRSGRKALFARDLDNNAFELFEYSTGA